MSAHSGPERQPYAEASVDVLLDLAEHQALRQGIMDLAHELIVSQIADRFDVDLQNIALDGTILDQFRAEKSIPFTHMLYNAKSKLSDPTDASVRLWFVGDRRADMLQYASESSPVEFGRNKMFQIFPYGAESAAGAINCADLGVLLDFAIPDTGRFSALSDPRADNSFSQISLRMADYLKSKAKGYKLARTYRDKQSKMTDIGDQIWIDERISSLTIEETAKTTEYSLRVASPVLISDPKLEQEYDLKESYNYRFVVPVIDPKSGKPVDNNKVELDSVSKLTLFSPDVPTARLKELLITSRKLETGFRIGELALESLQAKLDAKQERL